MIHSKFEEYMATLKCGNITANYSADNVEDYVVRDIAQTIQKISWHYPNDFFYNMAYPSLTFEMSKKSDAMDYEITLKGYNWVADAYLKFTKELYYELQKKYRISIVFLSTKGTVTLNYSDSIYTKTILKNNLHYFILIPLVSFLVLFLSDWMINNIPILIDNKRISDMLLELSPLIFYVITFLAYKTQPMILMTRIINTIIILLSAFGYYYFTGNGLWGSLILMGILSIQLFKTFI